MFGGLRNRDLALLQRLPLRSLDVAKCGNLHGAGVGYLAGHALTSLNVARTDVTDEDVLQLAKLPLVELCLEECFALEAAACPLALCPLRVLNLAFTDVRDSFIGQLPATIEALDLQGCELITDAGLRFLSVLPLRQLCLANTAIGDAGLAHLKDTPLSALDLTLCRNVTDAGLFYLSRLPLHTLNISWCDRVSDAGLAHLAGAPLQRIRLFYCTRVTEAGLALLSHIPQQPKCFFQGCNVAEGAKLGKPTR